MKVTIGNHPARGFVADAEGDNFFFRLLARRIELPISLYANAYLLGIGFMDLKKIPGRGDFFAVDRRAWSAVFEQTGFNGAIAYLILARGSLADMRTTSWSAEAINQRTKLNWRQAKEAIERLVNAALIRQDKGGSKPRYFILPLQSEAEPEWIWLPNTLVDGIDGEPAPIEMVRQSGRPAALRLLIDLYGAQELADIGGVHWRQLRKEYSREKLGQQGLHAIWGFRLSTLKAWDSAPFVKPHLTGKMVADGQGGKRDAGWQNFWDALAISEHIGLVYFVPHIVEHDHEEGERAAVVHPYGWPVGEPIEQQLAVAAHNAGGRMLAEWKRAEMQRTGQGEGMLLLPVKSHIVDVQMVGLARLRFRTRSSATAIWVARMAEWEGLAAEFEEMGRTQSAVKDVAC